MMMAGVTSQHWINFCSEEHQLKTSATGHWDLYWARMGGVAYTTDEAPIPLLRNFMKTRLWEERQQTSAAVSNVKIVHEIACIMSTIIPRRLCLKYKIRIRVDGGTSCSTESGPYYAAMTDTAELLALLLTASSRSPLRFRSFSAASRSFRSSCRALKEARRFSSYSRGSVIGVS